MKNETLEQQRKAREEYLKLKRIQNGEEQPEAVSHIGDAAPKTFLGKIANIWYHDKWFIIVGVVIIVIVTALVFQIVNKPKYDLEIVLFSTERIADENADLAAKYLSRYFDDINGDGKTNIQIINCSYNPHGADKNYEYANISKIQAILASDANALLYITDGDGRKYLDGITDGSVFEDDSIMLDEDFYEYCNKNQYFELPQGLQISCRSIENALISRNEKIDDYYKASKAIMKGLESK